MIKIIEVIADASLSGAPKHVLIVAKGINRKKFQTVVICPNGWLSIKLNEIKIKNHQINLKSFSDISSVSKLRKIINTEKPDIVHLHGIRAGWLGYLSLLGLNNKIIYTEHLYTKDYHLKNSIREKIQLAGLKKIANRADLIITPSNAVKGFLEKITKNKIIMIPNGLADFYKKSRIKTGNTLGFVGSLNHQKGLENLIEAMGIVAKSYPRVLLEVIGSGPLERNLKLKIKREKLTNNIKLIGSVADIGPYLAKWKFLVVPSISESFGQVVLEAAMFSKPVIATLVGGLPEVIKDNKTGILVEKNNIGDLSKAITRLINNSKLASKLGLSARKNYLKLYTEKIMVNKIENEYLRIAKGENEFSKTKR